MDHLSNIKITSQRDQRVKRMSKVNIIRISSLFIQIKGFEKREMNTETSELEEYPENQTKKTS